MRVLPALTAVAGAWMISACQPRQDSGTTLTQAFRGEFQSGQSSIVNQQSTGQDRFEFIEVIQEPDSQDDQLITVASASFNPATGTSRFQYTKPYSCLVTTKTANLNDDILTDTVLTSTCHWMTPGSRQVFKSIPKRSASGR